MARLSPEELEAWAADLHEAFGSVFALPDFRQIAHLLHQKGWRREVCPNCDGTGWWWCDIEDDEHIRQRCPSGCIDRVNPR